MRSLPHPSVLIVILFAMMMFGCAPSKRAQCNSVIEIANRATEEAKTLTDGGQTNEPQAMLQAADTMEKAAQEMKSLELTDERLQEYQTGFVEMYVKTAQATRSFVDAFEKKDRTNAEAALTNLQKATQPEKELVNGINSYCTQN
ncbi:hypothetical protein PN462_13995 [Spirulina sp. CS-785/01]|uniref:hypothetical protein n=1 Tax=Spirulina sp. CS-785/01 TaxID=3021716 RepID=UPI00232A8299|nr:hypothetical protein [Spirulina sp. CS-785/01]MDB9314220.1 hypothetical protein [Spirulina sp. CS-785/01]